MSETVWTTTGGTTVSQTIADQAAASAAAAAASAELAAQNNVGLKISSNDTTADFLETKVVAGSNVTLSVLSEGGNEQLQISATGGGGGGGGLANIVEDTTPQLGGDLDTNQNKLVTASNRDLEVEANGTGKFVVRGNTNSGKLALNCESNSHAVVIAGPPHSAAASYELTLPTSLSAGAIYTSAGGQLSAGTLPIASGGTGATSASAALTALGGASTGKAIAMALIF